MLSAWSDMFIFVPDIFIAVTWRFGLIFLVRLVCENLGVLAAAALRAVLAATFLRVLSVAALARLPGFFAVSDLKCFF